MYVPSCDLPTLGESGGKMRTYSRGLTPKSGKARSRSGIVSFGVAPGSETFVRLEGERNPRVFNAEGGLLVGELP